jgi:hypothetical protein
MCPYCICIHILRIIHIYVISSTKKDKGGVIPHQSNAVNIPHQINAGLRYIFRKWDVWVWTGSRWLRIRTGGRHLRMRQ